MLVAAWALSLAVRADDLPGNDLYLAATLLRVVDGDTIQVRLDSGPITIRLHGIDTPEASQPLGSAATKALRSRVEGEPLEIEPIEQNDGYGRMVAKVHVRGDDINAGMVRSGYAWAYRRYLRRQTVDERYCRLEAEARGARRGIWSVPPEEWQPPWEVRARERGDAVAAVSYAAETPERCIAALGRRTSAATAGQRVDGPAAAAGCRIKGNINARGDRIYHMPGMPSYADTRIDESRGERWFCSTSDAERAGWRAPLR
ncbi:MAG: thermonuclease family protein [Chromatiales bacterium]|nr:thermonuclease family protein [Chromatiales bacterium]